MAFSRRLALGLLGAAAVVALPCCGPPKKPEPSSPSEKRAVTPSPTIGTATMREDGTIEMQLRAETESGYGNGTGIKGDALVTYPPGDPHYEEVLKHLGGLNKGETKPVPPWPEKK